MNSEIRIISGEYQISMENLEAIVRVGKEIGLTEEELQSWVKEEQDFLIGEQKWCKDMIELKEKRLMIQAEEIKELKDTVEKMKDERDNIFFFFFFKCFYSREKKNSPPVQIGTDSGALQSDLYR